MDAEEAAANRKFGLIRVLEDYIAELERTKESIGIVLEFSHETEEIVRKQQRAEQTAYQHYADAKRLFLDLFR